jgi:hypothetical protein
MANLGVADEGYSPDSNDVSTGAEESPLLESVTGKLLWKQTDKT